MLTGIPVRTRKPTDFVTTEKVCDHPLTMVAAANGGQLDHRRSDSSTNFRTELPQPSSVKSKNPCPKSCTFEPICVNKEHCDIRKKAYKPRPERTILVPKRQQMAVEQAVFYALDP